MSFETEIDQKFQKIRDIINRANSQKIIKYLSEIPKKCILNRIAAENRKSQQLDQHKFHPIAVRRGELYHAYIPEGIGAELSGAHLVIIIQNRAGNIYGSKVNVLPLEGDGAKINPSYQMQLCNTDLLTGRIDKDPSRIIIPEIITLDKARLERKIGMIKPEKMKIISAKLKKQLEL